MNLVKIFSLITAYLLTQHSTFAQENPTFQNGVLTIPHVDTPEQVGKYLDITLTPTGDGTWKLNAYKELGTYGSGFAYLEKVDLIMTDALPRQVFLQLSGWLDIGCSHQLGEITYRIENKTFNIVLTVFMPPPYPHYCLLNVEDFQKTIALPVYGLEAGTYDYIVNGKFSGKFTLDVANKLP